MSMDLKVRQYTESLVFDHFPILDIKIILKRAIMKSRITAGTLFVRKVLLQCLMFGDNFVMF